VFAVHFGVHLLFLGQVAATIQQHMCLELEAIFYVCYTPSTTGSRFEAQVAYSHIMTLALCSQDGIGFMESFFMNLLKIFRYLMIVMLDWNLQDEGLWALKFVPHITMQRNSILILFGLRVGSF
jgi:hypothetical protein